MTEFTFMVPFPVCSKKNGMVAARIGPRATVRKGPQVKAHEDAIALIALAQLGLEVGILSHQQAVELRAFAVRRSVKGSGVGEKRARDQITLLSDRIGALFGRDDCTLHVTDVVGASPREDCTMVTVTSLGVPEKRKRTGKRRDVLNSSAIVADALKGIAYDDDKQVVHSVGCRKFLD